MSEVGTWQVVALLQLFPLKKGKVSPESKDCVVYVYRVPQKSLNTTGYKLIENYRLISCIFWLPEMFKVSLSLPKDSAYCFTKTELWYVPLMSLQHRGVKWFLHHSEYGMEVWNYNILCLVTGCKIVPSFAYSPFFRERKWSWHTLDSRLGGLYGRFECGCKNKSMNVSGIKSRSPIP
jgi:hypothetical protein